MRKTFVFLMIGYKDVVDWGIEQNAQRVQVIDRRQALASLPFVDRNRGFKPHEGANVFYSKVFLLSQYAYVFAGCPEI